MEFREFGGFDFYFCYPSFQVPNSRFQKHWGVSQELFCPIPSLYVHDRKSVRDRFPREVVPNVTTILSPPYEVIDQKPEKKVVVQEDAVDEKPSDATDAEKSRVFPVDFERWTPKSWDERSEAYRKAETSIDLDNGS